MGKANDKEQQGEKGMIKQAQDFLSSVRLDVRNVETVGSSLHGHHPIAPLRQVAPPLGLDAEIENSDWESAMNREEEAESTEALEDESSKVSVGFNDFIGRDIPVHRFTLCERAQAKEELVTPLLCVSVVKFNEALAMLDYRSSQEQRDPNQFMPRVLIDSNTGVPDEDGDGEEEIGVSYAEWMLSPDGLGPLLVPHAPYRVFASHPVYRPFVLDDPEMRLSSKHTTLRMAGFVSSIMPFVDDRQLKDELNSQFRRRWPLLPQSLTLSKVRRAKDLLFEFAVDTQRELSTVALAYVYFEKLVFQHLVDKSNRRVYAGACFLIAYKFNESGIDQSMLASLCKTLEVDRQEVLSAEFKVLLQLGFKLYVDDAEALPHYNRLVVRAERTHNDALALLPPVSIQAHLAKSPRSSLSEGVGLL